MSSNSRSIAASVRTEHIRQDLDGAELGSEILENDVDRTPRFTAGDFSAWTLAWDANKRSRHRVGFDSSGDAELRFDPADTPFTTSDANRVLQGDALGNSLEPGIVLGEEVYDVADLLNAGYSMAAGDFTAEGFGGYVFRFTIRGDIAFNLQIGASPFEERNLSLFTYDESSAKTSNPQPGLAPMVYAEHGAGTQFVTTGDIQRLDQSSGYGGVGEVPDHPQDWFLVNTTSFVRHPGANGFEIQKHQYSAKQRTGGQVMTITISVTNQSNPANNYADLTMYRTALRSAP